MKIAHLIGKPGLDGGWIKPRPRPTPAIREQLEAAARSHRLVRVRLRPGLLTASPVSEIDNIIAPALKQLAASGKVRVIVNYGEPGPSGRSRPHETAEFEDGKTYDVSPLTALRLLNADPYRYLFEEVEDTAAADVVALAGADQSATILALAEQLRDANSRIAALEARPSTSTTPRKRKLSDALAPDAPASDEGAEETP